MAAQNLQDGLLNLINAEEIPAAQAAGAQIIDVREATETSSGMLPGARNLPLSQLRDLLDLLPKNQPVVVYCQVGLRGYIAQRFLSQNGYQVQSLNGGYKTWTMCRDARL